MWLLLKIRTKYQTQLGQTLLNLCNSGRLQGEGFTKWFVPARLYKNIMLGCTQHHHWLM